MTCSKKDDKSVPACEISKETENQQSIKENKKKDLVNIIKGMKVELSTVNVQTTKPPNKYFNGDIIGLFKNFLL